VTVKTPPLDGSTLGVAEIETKTGLLATADDAATIGSEQTRSAIEAIRQRELCRVRDVLPMGRGWPKARGITG
jgi:hypothetical protein